MLWAIPAVAAEPANVAVEPSIYHPTHGRFPKWAP